MAKWRFKDDRAPDSKEAEADSPLGSRRSGSGVPAGRGPQGGSMGHMAPASRRLDAAPSQPRRAGPQAPASARKREITLLG